MEAMGCCLDLQTLASAVICGFHDVGGTDVLYWVTHLSPSVECELWEDKGVVGEELLS